MDSLPKDVLIYLLQKLDAKSVRLIRQCSRRYTLHGQSDLIWHRLTMEEFGTVEKTDVIPAATIWFTVYRAFDRALQYIMRHKSRFVQPTMFVNRKTRIDLHPEFEALLFRRPDKSMSIPDVFLSPEQSGITRRKNKQIDDAWIQPRRGDTILDLNFIGYRNDGVSYWNGMHRISPAYDIDDYGSTPLEFAYPEFPPRYFYAGHGDHWNIIISQTMIDGIAKDNLISLGDEITIEWHNDGKALVGRLMIYCYDTGEFYFYDGDQTPKSNIWKPIAEDESEHSDSDDTEE